MLESKKDIVVLETNLSSASTKRSPFHLLSSIFSKKKQSILDNESLEKFAKQRSSDDSKEETTPERLCSDTEEEPMRQRCSTIAGRIEDSKGEAFRSPITHARRKNLKIDLENLHLSRQDNPYLKQLERFSLQEETLLSCTDFHSLAEKALLETEWQLGVEKDVDIHQHLVRSPPPQFPQNLSHFMYSQANSPKRQVNQTTIESGDAVEIDRSKKSKSLNPVQPKRDTGVLDPCIREVLEYQKSQLIAGIQHSLNIGPAKFGTAPVQKSVNSNSPNSRGITIKDSGSRGRNNGQQPVRTTTSSLPTYLDLEQASKKMPLGPIRIGRTLSDSICHDNKFLNNELK